jgi:hypothetical protein
MPLVQSILRDPVAPSVATSTPASRIHWIRECHRLYARDLAVEHLLAPRDPELLTCRTEAFTAALGFGEQCQATDHEIIMAADAEWADAMRAATEGVELVRRCTWRLCASGMPAEAIRRAAEDACERRGIWIVEELLAPLLTSVWKAAQPRRRGKLGVSYGRSA